MEKHDHADELSNPSALPKKEVLEGIPKSRVQRLTRQKHGHEGSSELTRSTS
jgi:hypothetical protein